jgi:DNA-binding NarL/FixJ family response regulator
MNVLIVDDDIDFRGLARAFLRRSFPNVKVSEYDPEVLGLPDSDFPWADFDVVLLDHELHAEHNGLDWLRRYASVPGAPAVVFTTGAGSERVAVQAMRLGAADYLSKHELDSHTLGEVVNSVLAERTARHAAAVPAAADAGEGLEKSLARAGLALRRLLGCGGTADVYLAERLEDRHTVVVKLLRSGLLQDAAARERFRREAELLHGMDSPHVVRVHAHGECDGHPYMLMEYLGHGDLAARIVAGGLDPSTSLGHLEGILLGLRAIHAQGVVHRDLKPSNIMFRYDESIALTDFGISKRDGEDPGFTATGAIVGTPSYISPEQADGHAADARSDLYNAGLILFEMLTGERPYRGASASALFMQHASAPVPRLPPSLERAQELVDGLMAKRPCDRLQDAAAALRLTRAVLQAAGGGGG